MPLRVVCRDLFPQVLTKAWRPTPQCHQWSINCLYDAYTCCDCFALPPLSRPRGAGSTWARFGSPPKSPTAKELSSRDIVLAVVGSLLFQALPLGRRAAGSFTLGGGAVVRLQPSSGAQGSRLDIAWLEEVSIIVDINKKEMGLLWKFLALGKSWPMVLRSREVLLC